MIGATATWLLLGSAVLILSVSRRRTAIALVAGQSLVLAGVAITSADGSIAVLIAGVVLLAKGIALPALLAAVVRRTPESGVLSERHPLARLGIGVAVVVAVFAGLPELGLADADAGRAAAAMVVLGITTPVVRTPAIFQVLGLLVAENGAYLAALSVDGGVPPVIELGLVFDVIVIVTVAAAFSSRIHEELGTSDTTLLRSLRD